MKLREYLKQFEGLDPDMEVYGYDETDSSCLETKTQWYIFAYVQELGDYYPLFKYYNADKFKHKVLIIS